jgi:hypothetical protein
MTGDMISGAGDVDCVVITSGVSVAETIGVMIGNWVDVLSTVLGKIGDIVKVGRNEIDVLVGVIDNDEQATSTRVNITIRKDRLFISTSIFRIIKDCNKPVTHLLRTMPKCSPR